MAKWRCQTIRARKPVLTIEELVIIESLLLQLNDLSHWQIALLATALLLEGAILAVFPEEIIITALGILWSQNKISFIEAMVAVQLGLLPANLLLVYLGSRIGPRLFTIPPFKWFLRPEAVVGSLQKLHRNGTWVVFGTRFIPLIRGPVYFATGLSRMSLLRFFRTDALASCIQIPLLLFAGATIGKNSSSLLHAYQKLGVLLAGLIAIGISIAIIQGRRKKTTVTAS